MGELMKKHILPVIIIVSIIVIIGIWFLKSRKTSESASEQKNISHESKTEFPLDISLRYIQGVNGQSSLLKIRLFSRKLLQQDIDNKVLHKGEQEKIEPLVVSCPEGFWTEGITFMSSEREKEEADYQKLIKKVHLVRAPEEIEWVFFPGKTYEALYEIPSSVILPPGSRLRIEAAFRNECFYSNDVVVPPLPTDKKERLIQEARVFINLENTDEVLRVAEELISSFPSDSSGYWFKGMILERRGNEESALAAYEKALKNFPPYGQEGNVESPLRLVEKIRKLRRSLENSE
jgi:tetratricopeptide (TPR) repeat protein